MRLITAVSLLISFTLSAPLFAADTSAKTPSPAQVAQQTRMINCNKEAANQSLKGDKRSAFMSSCLKSSNTDAGKNLTPQQQKMKDCNATAAKQNLNGDARKTFMSTCLKKTA